MDQTRRPLSPVVAVGLGMVLLHVCLRAWALIPSWFYTDDFKFLHDARETGLTWAYLVEPFDQQFMPVGRFLAWCVAAAGPVNWQVAATITLGLVALSALACLWMLVTLFGARWRILAPLALYLSSALVVPATTWWSAALNQVPWQLVFFLAVGSWVRYVRRRQLRWLAVTVLVLAAGLLAYVKVLLVLPVLVLLLLGWFVEGSLLVRIRTLITRWFLSLALLLALGLGYVLFYRSWVPQPFEQPADSRDVLDLAWTTLGESLVTGLLGGPWTWRTTNPPVATAEPIMATVVAAWVVLIGFLALQVSRRTRVLPAVALFTAYALTDFALLATTRAPVIGASAGQELRYLTDALPVAVLVLGLVTSRLLGAPGSSRARTTPRREWSPPPWLLPGLTAAVVAGGIFSSVTYAKVWHDENPGADYFENVRRETARARTLDVADQVVPPSAYPGFAPTNRTSYLLPLVSDKFRFPESTDFLVVLDGEGDLRSALIETGVTGVGGAPGGCSWPVSNGSVTIPLSGETFEWEWWARIGYLASADTPVTVTAGETTVEADLSVGLNSLFVRLPGSYDEIRLSGIDTGASVCIGTVEVGEPVPGGDL